MGIADEPTPRADDLDAITQMPHVRAFQITTRTEAGGVACGWLAVANDRRYEASMEPGDTIASLIARARVQLGGLADGGDGDGLTESTEKRFKH